MIAVVIPAYNEAQHIVETLEQIRSAGQYTRIVVDDGSEDSTGIKAAEHARVVRHALNRGMGAALATGTQYALSLGADIIVHFDADGQHQASDIASVIAPLQRGEVDVVFGSRYLGGSKVPWTKRYFLHGPARIMQYLMTGMRLTDVHNGFRALNRHAAKVIVIRQDRMAHASEIIYEVKRTGLRYCEVPVTILYQEYGQGFMAGLRIVMDLVIKKIF